MTLHYIIILFFSVQHGEDCTKFVFGLQVKHIWDTGRFLIKFQDRYHFVFSGEM